MSFWETFYAHVCKKQSIFNVPNTIFCLKFNIAGKLKIYVEPYPTGIVHSVEALVQEWQKLLQKIGANVGTPEIRRSPGQRSQRQSFHLADKSRIIPPAAHNLLDSN